MKTTADRRVTRGGIKKKGMKERDLLVIWKKDKETLKQSKGGVAAVFISGFFEEEEKKGF